MSARRVNTAVEMGGTEEVVRPERVSTKGTTTYPFDDVEVGQHFYVVRTIASVREALRRWEASSKEHAKKRFETWRGTNRRGEKCIVVKRVK